LERHKKTSASAFVRLQLEDAFAVQKDIAFGHFIIGVPGHYFGQSAFPGSVRTHHCVHFTLAKLDIEAADDFLTID
jgi:hypothetical protein